MASSKYGKKIDNITIKLKPVDGGGTLTIPVNPEKVKVKIGSNYYSFKTIAGGDYRLPKGKTVTEVSWSSVFFGKARKGSPLIKKGGSTDVTSIVKKLIKWMEQKKVLNLIISHSFVNINCTIGDFQPVLAGAYGDAQYSITLYEYKAVKIYTTAELNGQGQSDGDKPGKTKPRDDAPKKKDYTIKYGDTLWALTRKYYGKASWADCQKIYEANKETMDAEARKHGFPDADHGNRIWPGTVLTIPA